MRRELGGSFETEPLMLYKVNPGAATENGKLSVENEPKHCTKQKHYREQKNCTERKEVTSNGQSRGLAPFE